MHFICCLLMCAALAAKTAWATLSFGFPTVPWQHAWKHRHDQPGNNSLDDGRVRPLSKGPAKVCRLVMSALDPAWFCERASKVSWRNGWPVGFDHAACLHFFLRMRFEQPCLWSLTRSSTLHVRCRKLLNDNGYPRVEKEVVDKTKDSSFRCCHGSCRRRHLK